MDKAALKEALREMIRDGEIGVDVQFETRGGDYYREGNYGCCVWLTIDREPVSKPHQFIDGQLEHVDSFDYLPNARF